jgi:hypothetical protein
MIPAKSPRFAASYAFSGTSRVIKRRSLRQRSRVLRMRAAPGLMRASRGLQAGCFVDRMASRASWMTSVAGTYFGTSAESSKPFKSGVIKREKNYRNTYRLFFFRIRM